MPRSDTENISETSFASPDRILVATDLTDADYLLPHAIAQAQAGGAHVTLIHAVNAAVVMPVEIGIAPYIDETVIDEDIELMLQRLARRIESQGVVCDILLRHGTVAEAVGEAIRVIGATRLIMGTHGRGKAQQFVLGSIAQTLLRSMDVPVFTVGPHAHDSRQALPRQILHPVSLVGNYQGAAQLAINIAEAYQAELTLLHVNSSAQRNNNSHHPHAYSGDQIMEAIAALVPPSLKTSLQVSVKTGHVVGEILNAATEMKADWIVLGVDGDLPYWPLQDSTAYKVVAAAHCPVLSLRHDRNQVESTESAHSRYAGIVG